MHRRAKRDATKEHAELEPRLPKVVLKPLAALPPGAEVRLDGKPVAETVDDLSKGHLLYPITITEQNTTITDNFLVATGADGREVQRVLRYFREIVSDLSSILVLPEDITVEVPNSIAPKGAVLTEELITELIEKLEDEDLWGYAEQLGLDVGKVKAAVQGNTYKAKINASRSSPATSTPRAPRTSS